MTLNIVNQDQHPCLSASVSRLSLGGGKHTRMFLVSSSVSKKGKEKYHALGDRWASRPATWLTATCWGRGALEKG